jgi:hypothetical protein
MTLDTRIYVLDQIRHKDVFAKCGQLIGATESTEFVDGPMKLSDEWWVWNRPGQGLCALLDVRYRPGVALRTVEQATEHDDLYCNLPGGEFFDADEPVCDGADHKPAAWLEVSFDTAYGYRDEQGRGCGDLHASLVSQLGQWLDERVVRWLWQNEFTGEIHSGYGRLIDLCSGGFEAAAWFQTTVAPAIARHAESR